MTNTYEANLPPTLSLDSGSGESDVDTLYSVARRVRWLAAAIVDAANRGRANSSGVKTGGHQASSASMVEVMVALWFADLNVGDRVSVKPHASPVLHAISYLLSDLDAGFLSSLRSKGGLQAYPSRSKDPDTVDFSTGSVGIGATAGIWAALAHRYVSGRPGGSPTAGRFISLLGDAELDEGAVWEALCDPLVAQLGEVLWIVDLNRQSLDRVMPNIQADRLQAMFEAAGWQVITVKWGRSISALFDLPGGHVLRNRLNTMNNEEYQRLLRAKPNELHTRLIGSDGWDNDELAAFLRGVDAETLARALRDLGGHDIPELLAALSSVDDHRPTVLFAFTVKGRGLPTEGHPNNHSALLTAEQMAGLADECGTSVDDPWRSFAPGTPEAELCARRAAALKRDKLAVQSPVTVPRQLAHPHRRAGSTQAALGRLLSDLTNDAPDVANLVVTCSPDVASSTNLGGWINKTGVWTTERRRDWFADDSERVLRWSEQTTGQHIELGIAEVNLAGLLGELGATWSRWGTRLIPIGTLYDPFVSRALEPWSFGIYAGGQSILVGTPSGVTLAPEGGAHQSITTPSIGLEQPGCIAWEPAFSQDLEWCLLHAMSQVGVPGGTSSYFRLSTRPIDPALSLTPDDDVLKERRRRLAVAGGYRVTAHEASRDDVTLVGVGAVMPEVIEAAAALARAQVTAGVVCLTSPDLVFREWRRGQATSDGVLAAILPPSGSSPLVTVHDGHPHTLSFLGSVRGDQITCLGVTDFGQSSSLEDAYALHGLDVASIVDAALRLAGR